MVEPDVLQSARAERDRSAGLGHGRVDARRADDRDRRRLVELAGSRPGALPSSSRSLRLEGDRASRRTAPSGCLVALAEPDQLLAARRRRRSGRRACRGPSPGPWPAVGPVPAPPASPRRRRSPRATCARGPRIGRVVSSLPLMSIGVSGQASQRVDLLEVVRAGPVEVVDRAAGSVVHLPTQIDCRRPRPRAVLPSVVKASALTAPAKTPCDQVRDLRCSPCPSFQLQRGPGRRCGR